MVAVGEHALHAFGILLHLWSNTKADAQCKSWCEVVERRHVIVFLGVAVLAWSLVLLAQGTQVGWEHLRPFGTVVGILVFLGWGFERVLWHLVWLHGWFVRRPDLRGTWRVELQSDCVDPATQGKVPTIVCYMRVVQSLSRLQMHLMTKESESWFIAESVTPSPNCIGYQIAGVYTNKPHTHLRGDRSEIHLGGLILNTHGRANRPETLMGEYWTDRKTKGRLTLSARMPKVLTRFEDAEASFSAA